MSVDVLQDRIRKMKNPSVIDFGVVGQMIPDFVRSQYETEAAAWDGYSRMMLDSLKELVPAVRFSMSAFALLGPEGVSVLQDLLKYAKNLGYYVLLDGGQVLSPQQGQATAAHLLGTDSAYTFDGLILSAYLGSDVVKPVAESVANSEKAAYFVVRTGNKSASALQDLMTGPRLVHTAAADIVNRYAEPMPGRSGYLKVGAVAGASSADGLRMLRSKYPRLFLLLDGYDYPNANAKNCSYAFDRLGHGAAAMAGSSVLGAWQEEGADPENYLQLAIEAAERMKKNLCRYITIL